MLSTGKHGNVMIQPTPDVPPNMDEPRGILSHAFPGRANGNVISQQMTIKVRIFNAIPSIYC
jgi:hypothetical protein